MSARGRAVLPHLARSSAARPAAGGPGRTEEVADELADELRRRYADDPEVVEVRTLGRIDELGTRTAG